MIRTLLARDIGNVTLFADNKAGPGARGGGRGAGGGCWGPGAGGQGPHPTSTYFISLAFARSTVHVYLPAVPCAL